MFQYRTVISPDLVSVVYCYLYSLVPPFLLIFSTRCPPKGVTRSCPLSLTVTACLITTQVHPPTREFPVSVLAFLKVPASLAALCMWSSAPLSVPYLRFSLASPCQPSITDVEISFSLPPLSLPSPDSFLHALSAAQNTFYSIPHMCPWLCLTPSGLTAPPPSALPLSFSRTLYIGRNSTHSATVVCRQYTY